MAQIGTNRLAAVDGGVATLARVTGTCDSCGREEAEADLEEVHRVYVTPEAWDTPGRVQVVDEVERWCFACRAHYPHESVER